ncbi:MAG: UbiA family prenyltransferase [Bacteroidia bacterium]|nr:UbiA family prenyltransferase [Bacteroidia bacterium]
MFRRNTLLHLRIPFSFFLLPIYCFALSQAPAVALVPALVLFAALHLFVYPASNAYNSYHDRDEGPIGLLKSPPPVDENLFRISLLFDALGLALGLVLGWAIALQLAAYSLISRAYSWPGIRLKKYPWASWAVVSLFQGGFTYLLCYQVIAGLALTDAYRLPHLWAALATTLQTAAIYPLTQIYQHAEDRARGDRTLSLVLGVRGTFIFSAAVFALSVGALLLYFRHTERMGSFWLLQAALLPVVAYFGYWALKVWRHPGRVRYEEPMRLNLLSAALLSAAFLYLAFWGY